MAFLDPADLAARLLRRPLTDARLRKFARLCRTETIWEAALLAIPEPPRAEVRAGTRALIVPQTPLRREFPS